ncbi:MAG TPA: FxLYD domain-containing protein [Ktedonobacteraceae bacterium]|nr:FxLYD domain-containing protein [Ktedonobacteraceae bacterium]
MSATSGTPTVNSPNAATATAAVEALIKEMTFVGTPTAKIVAGTTFEVDGKIKNGDSKQHDIFVEASLLDASGKVIVTTAPLNVDDIAGGETVPYSIQGTTPQPTWASVKVTVVKVTENVNGTGTD